MFIPLRRIRLSPPYQVFPFFLMDGIVFIVISHIGLDELQGQKRVGRICRRVAQIPSVESVDQAEILCTHLKSREATRKAARFIYT